MIQGDIHSKNECTQKGLMITETMTCGYLQVYSNEGQTERVCRETSVSLSLCMYIRQQHDRSKMQRMWGHKGDTHSQCVSAGARGDTQAEASLLMQGRRGGGRRGAPLPLEHMTRWADGQ